MGGSARQFSTSSVIEGRLVPTGPGLAWSCDDDCRRLEHWRSTPGNQRKLQDWAAGKGGGIAVSDLLYGEDPGPRREAAASLIGAR